MKGTKFLGQLFVFILLMIFSSGCGGGGGSSSGDEGSSIDYASKVRALDLSGAEGIYITGGSSQSSSSATLNAEALTTQSIEKTAAAVDLDPNSIYKITNDGRLERVAIEDKDGNELPRASVQPVLIQDLNSLYLVLWLKIAGSSAGEHAIPYLVHKNTGFAYGAADVVYNAQKTTTIDNEEVWEAHPSIQWDKENNFYVNHMNTEGTKASIYKIDTSTLGNSTLTVTEIPSAYSFENTSWMVDKTGEFIVFGNDSIPVRYLSISTGSLYNINNDIPGHFNPYWILGLDDKIYTYVTDDNCDDTKEQCTTWYNIAYDANKVPAITEIAKTNDIPAHWAKDRYVIGGKLVYISEDLQAFVINEVNPRKGTVVRHSDSFIDKFSQDGIKKYVVSNNDVYVFGELANSGANGFYKYNIATRSGKEITVDSDYDVKKFTALANGSFVVEGIRLSDQAYFYGELAEDGTVTVKSTVAIGAPQVLFMEAIRPADFMTIDGNPEDWPTSLRILDDVADDNSSSNGDLRHYSQTTTTTQYFGMLEYEGDLNASYYLRISFEGNETLQFQDNNISFLPDTSLSSAGGTESKGSVIEFSMPLTTVATPNVVSVELFGQTATGDINTSDSIDKMPN